MFDPMHPGREEEDQGDQEAPRSPTDEGGEREMEMGIRQVQQPFDI